MDSYASVVHLNAHSLRRSSRELSTLADSRLVEFCIFHFSLPGDHQQSGLEGSLNGLGLFEHRGRRRKQRTDCGASSPNGSLDRQFAGRPGYARIE